MAEKEENIIKGIKLLVTGHKATDFIVSWSFHILFAVLLLVLIATLPSQATAAPAVITPGIATGPIRLDGRLDEPEWQHAAVIATLTQQSPVPGGHTPYHTEVRLLMNRDNIYIGIRNFDPEPGKIAVHTLKRDGNLRGDDSVTIVFDTFLDHRSGFFFRINAAGARQDGLVSGPGEWSLDWDGIWNARTRRTKTGWTAEIVIPAKSLRFTPGLKMWGFNVQRFVARTRTTLRWVGASLNASFFDLRRAGLIAGVDKLQQGLGLDITPFVSLLANTGFGSGKGDVSNSGGVDIRYNLTPELTAIATVNTSFGETEVDSGQVNLTRFPLFFPEKRPFFTQGSNQFTFGLGLGGQFIPFFSRRIGLFNGGRVPINFGLKILGRQGPLGIAVLDVDTRSGAGVPGTNMAAGRLTYDINSHLRLGTIFTHGDPDGVNNNSLIGADAVWRTSTFRGNKNLALGAWTARSAGTLAAGRRSGWGIGADYPNDLWYISAHIDQFGEALNPALGFLPRPGTIQYRAGLAYKPRPSKGAFSWVRQFFFEAFYNRVDQLNGPTQSWRLFTAPINIQTQSGEHFEVNWMPQFERLDQPFEISPGVIIPPGRYRFTRFRAEFQTARTRSWRIGARIRFGTFYTGRLVEVQKFITWTTLSGKLSLGITLEDDSGRLPEGNFVKRLWQGRANYAFTPDLIFSSFTQFDTDTGTLGMNNRLRWTIEPGRNIFIVWNRNWKRPLNGGLYNLQPEAEQFLIKLLWTFRS
ncbi:MAG: carbohydrate binding family 9 domain-containing protein [Alphaproteobacteria bacterium]|nr:carbohydrate binding family 9 domain-containing protein [Alphaproteobacteria bacterium]